MISEWEDHQSRVAQALAQRNGHELRMHAHTLKSLLAMFHAEGARRKAMDIEHAALNAEQVDWLACQRLYEGLVEEMGKVRPALTQYVSTKTIV